MTWAPSDGPRQRSLVDTFALSAPRGLEGLVAFLNVCEVIGVSLQLLPRFKVLENPIEVEASILDGGCQDSNTADVHRA